MVWVVGAAAGGVVQFVDKAADVAVVVPPVGPQGLLPGRVLQRFVEQIIDEDGVVLAVVYVPVNLSDKFLQSSSLAWRCPSFSSSTEWQRRHFCGDSTGAVLGEGG